MMSKDPFKIALWCATIAVALAIIAVATALKARLWYCP